MKFGDKGTVIAVVNHKGGAGKTTTAVNLSAALAEAGFKTCLIDIDRQCNATENFIDPDEVVRRDGMTIAHAFVKKVPAAKLVMNVPGRLGNNLFIISGNTSLGTVPQQLEAMLYAEIAKPDRSELDADDLRNANRRRLKQSVESLREEFDFVICDTPPDLEFLTTSALIAADWAIVPLTPGGYDVRGLEKVLSFIEKVKGGYNRQLELLGILVVRYHVKQKLDMQLTDLLRQAAPTAVFDTHITESVKQREATMNKLTVLEHATKDQAAMQFRQLAVEVCKRVGVSFPNLEEGETSSPVGERSTGVAEMTGAEEREIAAND